MSLLSKISGNLFKTNKCVKICFIGLDRAGKSSIIKKLLEDEFNPDHDRRTLGMEVATLKTNGVNFVTWDLGGQKAFRDSLWNVYLKGAKGIVYVIDSSEPERLNEAKKELFRHVFRDPVYCHLPTLILANKQDKQNVLTPEMIHKTLNLDSITGVAIKIFPISCKSGLNVEYAFEWLADQINMREHHIHPQSYPITQAIN